jgi:hypothetical protein
MLARDGSSELDSTAANKALVRRYIDEANNRGDLALVDDLLALDYVWHGGPPSRDALKHFIAWQHASAPDWHITIQDLTIQDLVAEGDRVAVCARPRRGRGPKSRRAFHSHIRATQSRPGSPSTAAKSAVSRMSGW